MGAAVAKVDGVRSLVSAGVASVAPRLDGRNAPEVALRLALIGAGLTPVTLIAATAFGVADLRALAAYVLVPVLVATAVLVATHPRATALLATALVAGLISTLLYDGFRFAFLGAGLMHHDPIPHIGDALQLRPAWVVGYLWRYFGNGAGLAVAFLALGLRGARAGVLYGLGVCAGLVVVLAASPFGQQMLFPLTPITIVMATGGHAIYGAALGWISDHPGGPARLGVGDERFGGPAPLLRTA